jgi:hypothetical protein
VTQLVLPLHECVVEPFHAATEYLHSAIEAIADPIVAESAIKHLHSVADPAGGGATSTEISCLLII